MSPRAQPAPLRRHRQVPVLVVMVAAGILGVLGSFVNELRPPSTDATVAQREGLPAGFPLSSWEPASPPDQSASLAMGLPRLDATALSSATATPRPAASVAPWLHALNELRASAMAPPVSEDLSLSAGALAHAKYMATAAKLRTSEDETQPGYSAAGAAAARSSLLLQGAPSSEESIMAWSASPFHLATMIDASLGAVGAGWHRGFTALNVLSRREDAPPSSGWPRVYPHGPGVHNLRARTGGRPDAVTGCGASSEGWGAPIVVDFGPGDQSSLGTATAVLRAGTQVVPACVRTSEQYGKDAWVLGPTKALVFPQQPLRPQTRYRGTVTTQRGAATVDFFTGRVRVQAVWHADQPEVVVGKPTTVRATITSPDYAGSWSIPVQLWLQTERTWHKVTDATMSVRDGRGVLAVPIKVTAPGNVVMVTLGTAGVHSTYTTGLTVRTP